MASMIFMQHLWLFFSNHKGKAIRDLNDQCVHGFGIADVVYGLCHAVLLHKECMSGPYDKKMYIKAIDSVITV